MRIAVLAALLIATPAVAQEQQAGNEASTNAEETFQSLIEQCDDTDALAMRARIRLLISRTTDEAATEAQRLLDEGFAACGEGNMETAMANLEEARSVAEAGTEEVFGGGGETEAETTEASAPAEEEDEAAWWQFWK